MTAGSSSNWTRPSSTTSAPSPPGALRARVTSHIHAEQANVALQTGLVWDSEYKKTELYDRACRIQECSRCHKYGHISAQCGGQQKCGLCAGCGELVTAGQECREMSESDSWPGKRR